MHDHDISIIPMATAVDAARASVLNKRAETNVGQVAAIGMRIAHNLRRCGLTPAELRSVGAWCRCQGNTLAAELEAQNRG